MSWFASWLPSIPTINLAIPTSIQGRFVSFFLKKFLGHLFKPGQLDTPQIDSQIGSGYVQINDLELDPTIINSYLTGLPLLLETGTAKAVTARIPWPNPLTSNIGFSLSGLHLTLRVQPSRRPHLNPDIDLADSVVSVAESFVQEELSDPQEAKLWESFHAAVAHHDPETDDDHTVPGGLESFVPDSEGDKGSQEVDPIGVSMFATLIERLLARFHFDARDISITVVDPDNITLKFSLSEIRYSTREGTAQGDADSEAGMKRSLSLHGIKLSSIQHIPNTSRSTTRPSSPTVGDVDTEHHISRSNTPSSSSSSSSSLDEDAQFQMSQSLAVLPPRPNLLAESTTSSIYHSIISEAPTLGQSRVASYPTSSETTPPNRNSQPERPEISGEEHVVLSFGAVPLEICLTTPPPGQANPGVKASNEKYRVDISCGSIAIALQPWQVSGVLHLMEKLSDGPSSQSSSSKSPPKDLPFTFDAEARIRSISFLLFASPLLGSICDEPIDDYFEHPLVPPRLGSGYTRLLIDTAAAHASWLESGLSASLTVGDFSVFQFTGSRAMSDPIAKLPAAIPVLITDPYLPSQYDSLHVYPSRSDPFQTSVPQPTIPVLDWFDKKCFTFGAKISHWRTRKNPQERHRRHANQPKDDAADDGGKSRQPSLCLRFDTVQSKARKRAPAAQRVAIDVAPLQAFVDIEMLQAEGGMGWFSEHVNALNDGRARKSTISARDGYLSDEEAPASPIEPPSPPAKETVPVKRSTSSSATLSWTINVPMLRLSVRAPPPPNRPNRSGILTFDVHKIVISDKAESQPPQLRFAAPSVQESGFQATEDRVHKQLLAQIGCARIVAPSEHVPSLTPQISISRRNPGEENSILVLSIDIPSVYIAVSKKQLDALQYWIDDLSQAMERMNASRSPSARSGSQDSKDTSLIGSRFFSKSRMGSGFDLQRVVDEGVKVAVSINVTEFYGRVHLPRSDGGAGNRPFDVACSDLSVDVKMHTGGKIEALINLMDILVQDTEASDNVRTFLSLTSQRSLMAIPVPLLKLRFISSTIPETTAKETKFSISLNGFTFNFYPDLVWLQDIAEFSKSPPGTFESVVPSERTLVSLKITDGSIRALAPSHPGAMVLAIGGLNFVTDIIGNFPDTSFRVDVAALSAFAIENIADRQESRRKGDANVANHWRAMGYALLADLSTMKLKYQESKTSSPARQIIIDGLCLKVHACADTFAVVGAFAGDLASLFKPPEDEPTQQPIKADKGPAVLSRAKEEGTTLTGSIDEAAFRRVPEVGPAPDMIYDDLPTNLDYLDESFGAAAGLRELTDDDFDEFDAHDIDAQNVQISDHFTGVISSVGGETIKLLHEDGINIIENYYDTLPRETIEDRPNAGEEAIRVRIHNCDVYLLLYDGYDWPRTRKIIESEVKEMRKRLAKIRQLVANGQVQEPQAVPEDTGKYLFNSLYIGVNQDVDAAEPDALIAAIDEELREDFETGTQIRVQGKKLNRSKTPSMEFCLLGVNAEFNQYNGDILLVSRTFVTVKDLEILDHIKTSTWKKFLTALRSDSKGNIRETGASMVRIELHNVRPAPGETSQEARLRAKILPIRLYVDQDAVDFLKKFFSFKDPEAPAVSDSESSDGDAFIQMAEIFPIDLKLDYKPRRVDYRALKEGRTIELMNFFHFDGAEMTLRHIKLAGITGWPKVFEMLNDLWTPDVKATQLVDVISGVAPIRSMVNVGSGVADLVLLPISQYKKDGRIVRGVQKGATAFVKSTAIEAIKMGARLATGTQVILEQAEGLLGGDFDRPVTAETVPVMFEEDFEASQDDELDMISKYAQQPADIKEGVQSAYRSLQKNLSSAAQTILAVPMEVYERSGNEGPVRSVIRAVPIAVLKPMIGASEAVSKTLLGLHNTLDPNVRLENEAKYK
ncbi:hypothetical protein CC1G_04213 [Coprinopsis cinerea okayama7|uniref:Autophagy-related protein 2 n=1 Tax=Coprinopsis cinerea (strain Okayama-7 / 130 / ATCC MYA-4618 / FGSC 9003) TaxID=240176 RepID=A8NFA2_COPC7|nr:hypothetical protein CC1G_04213 [Coprinopsis cinerea okayama7\|eukprot:XP_001833234.1 hypothetical protein CC1G_04213 [Coprinopsis cinerea okayama7\